MNPAAVSQARQRLEKAERALTNLKAATNFKEAEEAWTDFLLAASAIYSKLEQGSKGYPQSEPWFGRKKTERRNDPLLSYIHHARNSDEHGIERIVGMTPPNRDGLGRQLKFNERVPIKFKCHDPKTGEQTAEGEGVFAGPTIKPIRVYDRRFGDYFDPPLTHMGENIDYFDFVDGIAAAAFKYLTSLVSDAESLL